MFASVDFINSYRSLICFDIVCSWGRILSPKSVIWIFAINPIRSISLLFVLKDCDKIYIDSFLKKEIEYFQKKYGYKIELSGNSDLLIPEYSIELLNKNKKIVNKIENINKIKKSKYEERENKKRSFKNQKEKKPLKLKKNTKKNIKSSPRTLWVRKK